MSKRAGDEMAGSDNKSKGFIALYRSILDWEWYSDINVCRLFTHLLLKANHKDNKWHGKSIKKGCLITSLNHLSEETGLSVQQVRTSLNKLKSTNEITSTATNRFTLISVINYSDYQKIEKPSNKPNNSKVTNKQQTDNKQITNKQQTDNNKQSYNQGTIKPLNHVTKDIPESPEVDSPPSKHRYGEFKKVLLKDDEYEKLIDKFGEVDAKERIERLDIYIGSNKKGKNYIDHYRVILSWARKDEKEGRSNKPMTRAEKSDDVLRKWVSDE